MEIICFFQWIRKSRYPAIETHGKIHKIAWEFMEQVPKTPLTFTKKHPRPSPVQVDFAQLDPNRFPINFRFLYRFRMPMCSMYGILTRIYHINNPNVGKYTNYTLHGAYGMDCLVGKQEENQGEVLQTGLLLFTKGIQTQYAPCMEHLPYGPMVI